MPEEKKESLESKESVASKGVTDKELDSASEKKVELEQEIKEVKEELKETEVEVKEPSEELTEQQERSRLGRRLKRLEERLGQFDEKIDTVLSRFDQIPRDKTETPNWEEPIGEGLPEVVTTPQDVLKVLRADRKKEQDAQIKYEQFYAKKFRSFSKDDPDNYDEVFKEMFDNFNEVRTGNPLIDAELNYAKAKAAVFAKKTANPKVPKPNVKGEKSTVSTNLSVESRETSTPKKIPELDEYAKEFMQKVGMSEESVAEALKGETPIHLRGKI